MKRIITVILSIALVVLSIGVTADAKGNNATAYNRNSVQNIDLYRNISLHNANVTVNAGQIDAGKVLVVSAIPTYGGKAATYIDSIHISPSVSVTSGGWYEDSKMTYFKITSKADYNITIIPKASLSSTTSIDIYMYTVDCINSFTKYDALEGISGNNNYVVSNMPESLGSSSALLLNDIDNTSIKTINEAAGYQKTVLVDGTERYLPKDSYKKFVKKGNLSTLERSDGNEIVADKNIQEIVSKINNNEKLSMKELEEYNIFIEKNNLASEAVLAATDTSQLGEYGYYLSKSKINGNANVFWEHVSKYGMDMYYGILLQNTGSTSVNVTLNKRSFDSTDDSGPSSMNSIWADYFNGVKCADNSDLTASGTLTIPANSAKWVALYKVSSDYYYNIFNGQISISLKNTNGTTYTGNNVFCYSFIMTDWENSLGQTMYETVKANIGNGAFTRAAGATGETDAHISGTGNGATIIKNFSNVMDITGDRYSCILTGFDAPYLNDGELMSLYHDGPASGGTTGYTVPNGYNYGVVYKLCFGGFNSTATSENIKLKLKYNALVNPGAAANNGGAIYVTVMCNEFSNTPYTAIIGDSSTGYSSQVTVPWTIAKNTDFDLYIVVGGMSSLPLEAQFVAE